MDGELSPSTPTGHWSMRWSRCAGSTRPTCSTPWRSGPLSTPMIADLAHRIASFHAEAEISTRHGGVAGMAAVLDINDRSLRATGLASPREGDDLAARFGAALSRHGSVLEGWPPGRQSAALPRRSDPAQHLPVPRGPDAVRLLEFDEELATIDVLYDLAFLIMDLLHRGLADQANLLFNSYLDEADERNGLSLVAFFVAVRAAVRAHVTGARAAEGAVGRSHGGGQRGARLSRSRLFAARRTAAAPNRDRRPQRRRQVHRRCGSGADVGPAAGRAHCLDRPDPQEPSWGPSRTKVAG